MKLIIGLLAATLLSFAVQPAQAKYALVYSDVGTCPDGCPEAAAQIATKLGLKVRFVKAKDITPEIFKNAQLWIQPGGNAIKAAKAITSTRLAYIKKFVANGGGYVGFCAGAFLADKFVDDFEEVNGLGLIPIESFDYPQETDDGNGVMKWLFWRNQRRHVFFNGGASFILDKTKPVTVMATYGQDGLPATIFTHYKAGRVVVTGAHPEALDLWKQDGNLKDQDGPDFDIATEMVRVALGLIQPPDINTSL